jgi:hemoglobin/transferrin/lactoferrin receptor protein
MSTSIFAAQEGEQVANSPEFEVVVVEGERQSNSNIIDLRQKELLQANSIFDTLKNEASINIGGGGASNAKRIYVRGLESSTLNTTVDGASQGKNMFQHRGNELGINPDILNVIDVRTAPDASKAGALGGSIEMETKDAQDLVRYNETVGANVKAGYNSNTESALGGLTAYKVFAQDYGVIASVSLLNTENYTDGHDQEMLGTAYKDANYFLKFNMDNINGHNLALSFNQNTNSGDMQWGKTGSDKGLNVDPSLLEYIESTTTSYGLQHNYTNEQLLNLDSSLYQTKVLVDRQETGAEYENEQIGLKIQNHFYVTTASTKNKISVGFQIVDEESTSDQATGSTYTDASGNSVTSGYHPITSTNRALFLQGVTTIDDLDIRYGLRWDDYDLETGLGKASDNTISPNIGVDYQLNQHSNVYANYGMASRMTGTVPFTWMMHIADGYSYSSDLTAEKSARVEIGYDIVTKDLFAAGDSVEFDASIFQTEITDLILSKSGLTNASGKTSVAGEAGIALTDMINSDKEHRAKGFNLKASYFYDAYYASLSYSHLDTNTTIESAGEPLTIRRVSGFDSKKVVLNGGMELANGLTLNYTLTGVADINNDQLKREGYIVHDISAKYQNNYESPWTFYATILNLTDKYYADHNTLASGDVRTSNDYRREMGRDIRLSVKYEF